jgi:hypothetical protein
VSRSREELHGQAEAIVRQLVQRFGDRLPADVETTVRYYIACRGGYDRAAEHVLHLRRLAELGEESR